MGKVRTRSSELLLLGFIILSFTILSTLGDGGQINLEQIKQEKPSLSQTVKDTISLFRRSHANSWDKVKSIINQVQLNIFPPNLESTDEVQARGGDGTGGKMKLAAEKSFGASKVTVEESAKSAAKIVAEAVHKTTEKVKESTSDDHEPNSEL